MVHHAFLVVSCEVKQWEILQMLQASLILTTMTMLENRGQVVAERRATEMETRYISFGTWELVGQTNEECNNNMLRGNK